MWHRVKVPVAVFVLLAGLAYVVVRIARSREWLEFSSDRFWRSLVQVRFSYVLLGASLIFCSYFFRSLRWREFLAPMKAGNLAGSLGNIFASTLIGFSAVALLGRPGELVRPLLIARKENVALSSQLGAWTLERILDGLTIGIMMGVALLVFPPGDTTGAAGARTTTYLKTGGIIFCGGGLLLAGLLAQLRSNAQVLINLLRWFARALPLRYRSGFQRTLEQLLGSFAAGLASIGSASSFAVCAAFSVLVWIPVMLTYWVVAQAFGWPMSSLGPGAVVLLVAITVTGSLIQIPGIGGGYQIATVLVLTQLFGIPLEIASTAAILLWIICFMMVLIPGLPLAAREGLSWQRLRSLVKTNV